ncbi:DUF3624 domain-containing protein [Vibrio sp. PP-XX7]
MACNDCDSHWFWKKIGRCQRCINQLIILCLLFWGVWISWGIHHSSQVESIALLCFGVAFHLLLSMHLWVKFFTRILPKRHHHDPK